MFASALEPNGSDSGWYDCQCWYSVRRSKVRECCRYGGRTTALSRASRGSWTRRSQASRVTKANSRFFGRMCSLANWSNLLTASRKVPAFRTCSQVSVVRLAVDWVRIDVCSVRGVNGGILTAKWSDRGVDGFDEDTLSMELDFSAVSERFSRLGAKQTSSQVFASSRIQPSSMTSAESF